MSVGAELLFTGRGVRMQYEEIDYKLSANYFDLRFPIRYSFFQKTIRPYVFIAPSLDFALGGKIKYYSSTTGDLICSLSKNNIYPFDFSLLFGVGTKFSVDIGQYNFLLGVELAYNLGTVNTFSKSEKDRMAHALNVSYYSIEGTRRNSDFELTVSVGFPLKNIKKKEKPIIIEPAIIPQKVDTVIEEKTIVLKQKACYSLADMFAFITFGHDI